MQNVSQDFIDNSRGSIRKISYKVVMSFDKVLDENIDFFTIGQSLIGGSDLIRPDDIDVVQNWDRYTFTDYTSRVMSLEWSHQAELFASLTMGMADIVFDNHDDFFTPGHGSTISDYVLPWRPIRIYAGFDDELIPVFIGLTEKMPVIDDKAKTASFHCIDFLYSLIKKPLLESEMFIDLRSDEIIQGLFELAGLDALQLDLSQGERTIPFAYFEKDAKLGNALKEVLEVEQGRLFLSPLGVTTFRTRRDYSNDTVYSFNAYENIVDTKTRTQDDIINVVEIKGKTREVQPKQAYAETVEAILVPASGSEDVWVQFPDPVTSVDTPVYIDSATTSYYSVNTLADGTGSPSTGLTLTSVSMFAKAYKMHFVNNTAGNLYLTRIVLHATPATIVQDIFVREEDEISVEKYDPQVLSIENNFFQNKSEAQSVAITILGDFAELTGSNEFIVKGLPALELDDPIHVNMYDIVNNYKIVKITNKIADGGYTQILQTRNFTPRDYFTIGESLIGGTDQIHP